MRAARFFRFLAVLVAALTFQVLARAQTAPVQIEDFALPSQHLIGDAPVLSGPFPDEQELLRGLPLIEFWLQFTVSASGEVTEAQPIRTPADGQTAALEAAHTMRFEPFKQDGRPVAATFMFSLREEPQDYVGPADRTFPADADPSLVQITLSRSACYGTCPSYSVQIRGDGSVIYRGENNVLVTGEQRWTLPPEHITALLNAFREADYLALDGFHIADASDLPAYVTSLRLGDRAKFVFDYGAFGDAMASVGTGFHGDARAVARVRALEDEIDRLSGAAALVRVNGDTFAMLERLHWDFTSRASGAALTELVAQCELASAREFLNRGAPADVALTGFRTGAPLQFAPRCGDADFVQALIDHGDRLNGRAADAFLLDAARSGYADIFEIALRSSHNMRARDRDGSGLLALASGAFRPELDDRPANGFDPARIVRRLLELGADPRAVGYFGATPLHEAMDIEIVRLLLDAGADPNARDELGRTPIFHSYDADVVRLLLSRGARGDLRDDDGETPLFGRSSADAVRALLGAGADPNVVDKQGQTALSGAQTEEAVLALIDGGARLPEGRALAQLRERATRNEWTAVLAILAR